MGRTINSGTLSKAYILSKISQISIFSYYLNISPEIINNCIETGELITSPLREDWYPSCGFKYDNRGKLKFRDFGGYFWGDCFDAATIVINSIYNLRLNVNNKQDFIKVLRHITIAFKDVFRNEEKDENLSNEVKYAIDEIKKKKPIIDLVVRQWNNYDIQYWKQFGVDLKYLNINFVYPIEQFYINRNTNPEPKYHYDKYDPCYAYLLGKDKNNINNIKLYFPKRSKEQNRFITNCNHLEGILNLYENNYDVIVLTKSTKDRLSIGNTLLNIKSLYGGLDKKIGVINIPHETYKLRDVEYEWLKSKLNNNGTIISLMDNDRTGMYEAKWLFDNYYISPLIIPKETNCKDFAEYFNKFGINTVYNDIIYLINNYKEYEHGIQRITTKKESNSLPY